MKDVNYAWPVSAINKDDLVAFETWYNDYKVLLSERKLFLFGAGIRGTEFGIFLKRKGFNDFVFVDNNPEKIDGNIDGVPIAPLSYAINELKDNKAIILITTENDDDIIIQLKEFGLKLNGDFFVARNMEYENYVDEFKRNDGCKNIVVGDCMFSGISIFDNDTRNLAEMIRQEVGKEKCKVLYMHGMGIRAYYNVIRMHCKRFGFPNCVMFMVNPELLGGKTYLLPRTQHSRLFHMLDKELDIKDDEWDEYLTVVKERSFNISTELSHKSSKLSLEQMREIKNRNFIRLNYMYELNTQNEGIVFLKKLLEFTNEHQIRAIPFFPPVNYELGERYFGDEFLESYSRNLSVIRRETTGLVNDYEDLSFAYTSEFFAEPDTTDEEMNERGRISLMHKLVGRLEE